MAFLKFNKAELVNLSYSLKREIISANKTGAYCNTSIINCNTRKYHGLLAVTLDRFGGDKYLLLSSLDESLIVKGQQFNLGIHCYGDIYEPRGHKYIIDFEADPVPAITYKVGQIIFRKSLLLLRGSDRLMIRYELLSSPAKVRLQLRPFLSFRNIHALTRQNPDADSNPRKVQGGAAFCLYKGFPELVLQSDKSAFRFTHNPFWYKGITYSDEYRRGFDCTEDLLVPGWFEAEMKEGETLLVSASLKEEKPEEFESAYAEALGAIKPIEDSRDQLLHWADLFISAHNGRKKVNAGFSWMYTGLLRETLIALPGLTLFAKGDKASFEEVLDNLIADNQERLFRRTTQVEAPLYLACVLQAYIRFGADPAKVWKKYGAVLKGVLESYLPGVRKEVAMHPNGLLWAQMDRTALSWMNAYIQGVPVTERAGYQVETNALWYNAVCFALQMEKSEEFAAKWTPVRDLIKNNYRDLFWNERLGCLADYVDNDGQHRDMRPNQLIALWVDNSPLDEMLQPSVFRAVSGELETRRGIRTLSPRNEKYKGVYDGSQFERDNAYHQGSTRIFLLEYYVKAGFKLLGASFYKKAEWLTEAFYADLNKHGVGAFSELYDGDPPQEPHGAIASALSTAALLAVDYMMKEHKEEEL